MKEPLRVLFIEDNRNDADIMVHELKKRYQLVWKRVDTMSELIIALQDFWDVVLCDYSLPHLNALDALRMVENTPNSAFLPFIIVSGSVDEYKIIDLLSLGVDDFITKNNLKHLLFTVEREVHQAREKKAEVLRTKVKIEESYDLTLLAWAKAIELRDHHTGGHTQRVVDLTVRLAKSVGVPKEDYVCYHRGALLHDVGKMRIPDSVLLKPGYLTDEEMAIMRMHPKLAMEMLKDIPFLHRCLDIPYCHHERWNGTGYPRGLRGKDIPYPARLFSVIDVYDALTSDRPYRPSWEKARVIAYLIDEKNITFDAEVVDAFVSMIGRG